MMQHTLLEIQREEEKFLYKHVQIVETEESLFGQQKNKLIIKQKESSITTFFFIY